MKKLQRLYPAPFETVSLRGLYLEHRIHELGSFENPFVYANFLTTLDGRIALEDSCTGESYLPKSMTTSDDFRLFLELQAQADCLITHGGYMRALAAERLGNILQVGISEQTEDLVEWRRQQGLKPQPAIVVASASLDFKLPQSIADHGQECHIATGENADPARINYWENKGYKVFRAGSQQRVEGASLVKQLSQSGYRRLYLIAGPEMLGAMLQDGQLSRLYQTITHQLMGGQVFWSLLSGSELGTQGHLHMKSLYYDQFSENGIGQWFSQFDTL